MPTEDSALLTPLSDVAPSSAVEGKAKPPGKRPQVKNACGNCKKSCKKCENVRPCPRCIQRGIADTCVDSERKSRPMGMQRGPYRRRATTANGKPESPNVFMPYPRQNQNQQQLQYQQQQQNANAEYPQQMYNSVIPNVLVPQPQQFLHQPPHLSPASLQPSQYSTNAFITPLPSAYHVYNPSPLPTSAATSPLVKQYEQPIAQMTPLSALSILSDLALESDKSRLKELESTIGFDVSQFSPARSSNNTIPDYAPPGFMSSSLGIDGNKSSALKAQESTPLQTPDRSG
ncbi:UNVERIFIED_CONTAM: hypothetical protein HDU68_004469 [Siphonaria sp. JEL0065]|nr:hypothetical protein HDU68_004469 [Siphonaria sp. JEL0065]